MKRAGHCPRERFASLSRTKITPPTPTLIRWLGWLGGYTLYSLFHIVGLPLVLMRFSGRLKSGRYRGVISTRFWGGTKAPKHADWTLILASGLGETRTAVAAADEIARTQSVPVAVLTQLARIPHALKSDASGVPIGYAPFNSPHAALICLLRWRPKTILFVEFSGNYHLAFWARLLGIRTALINVNLPETRLRRLQRKVWGKWQFSFIDGFCVQAATHAERLCRLGVEPDRIVIAGTGLGNGSLALGSLEAVQEKWRQNLQIPVGVPVLVAGSTYPEEELVLLRAVERLRVDFPNLIFILAPRHLDRVGGTDSMLISTNTDFDRRTHLDRHQRVAKTILLDSVGELREVYAVANIAFIGGSLVTGVGGHSPLEAFAWGIPSTVGPHFGQQEAAVYACEEAGLLQICATEEALHSVWKEWLSDPELNERMKSLSEDYLHDAPNVFEKSYLAVATTS